MENSTAATFKQVDGVKRCSVSGAILHGKKVLQPLRFFVSDAGLNLGMNNCILSEIGVVLKNLCCLSQEAALRVVDVLRKPVEGRLEEIKTAPEACSQNCWCSSLQCASLLLPVVSSFP